MADLIYPDFPAGTYDTAKIILQSDATTGALEKINLPTIPVVTLSKIYSSNVQIAHTGTTSETTILTATIPANSVGVNGSLEFAILVSCAANNANGKLVRIKLAGSTVWQFDLASNRAFRGLYKLWCRNSANLQVTTSPTAAYGYLFGFSTTSTPAVEFTFDTAANISLTITVQNANSGDTTALEAFEITANV